MIREHYFCDICKKEVMSAQFLYKLSIYPVAAFAESAMPEIMQIRDRQFENTKNKDICHYCITTLNEHIKKMEALEE